MKNKKIKLNFRVEDNLNIYSYNVKFYDENNNLISEGVTNELGGLDFNVPGFGVYQIVVYSSSIIPCRQCLVLLVNENTPEFLLFTFNRYNVKKQHLITVNLTDKIYKGLPIMKGQVILWQDNT